MLTVEKFKERLIRVNHPDWMSVGADIGDESQLYIVSNGGMNNINCFPIEHYPQEIKVCVLNMIAQDELHFKPNQKSLRIDQGRNIYCYTLKVREDLPRVEASTPFIYFSNLFIRWQRTHQLSDKHAQEKLGLTAKEFNQFREDELAITQDLINKLAEVTGVSEQFWQNKLHNKIKREEKTLNKSWVIMNRSSDEDI